MVSFYYRGPSDEDTEFWTKINSFDREACFRSWRLQIRNQVDVPVTMVGGLRTFEFMEEIIQSKEADLVSLSRPLITEPSTINEWKKGDRHRATYISCNDCFESSFKGETLERVQLKRQNS
jgi:2,4-dienoyl-CoA reductase-like NADH-dependent reductase (Old Yellow Enzyme family)